MPEEEMEVQQKMIYESIIKTPVLKEKLLLLVSFTFSGFVLLFGFFV